MGDHLASVVSGLVSAAYERSTREVAGRPGRLRRDWVVRTRTPLPGNAADFVREVEARVRQSIRDAHCAIATLEQLAAATPDVSLTVIDPLHAVVHVEFSTTLGGAAATASWSTLQLLDAEWHIEELHGIPLAYWWLFRAAEEETGAVEAAGRRE